jgi:hypothetical protein
MSKRRRNACQARFTSSSRVPAWDDHSQTGSAARCPGRWPTWRRMRVPSTTGSSLRPGGRVAEDQLAPVPGPAAARGAGPGGQRRGRAVHYPVAAQPSQDLRAPGERANAQLTVWKVFAKLRCCPWRAGKLAKAIHVLQLRAA